MTKRVLAEPITAITGLTPAWVFLLAPLAGGCFASTSAMTAQFEHDRAQLSVELPLAKAPSNGFTIGQYEIIDLRPRRAPERSGQSYSFSLVRAAERGVEARKVSTNGVPEGDQKTILWNVSGVGAIGVRNARTTVSELVELHRPGVEEASWVLELFSGESYQIMGELRGRDGTKYDVDSVPMGTLLLGEDYGARLVCFMKNNEILAAVDIAADMAKVMMRPTLAPEEAAVFAGAAAAIALRSYVLGASGAAMRYAMLDPRWTKLIDCGADVQCAARRDDLIRIMTDPSKRRKRR